MSAGSGRGVAAAAGCNALQRAGASGGSLVRGGGGPAGPGAAVLHYGGSQGLQHGDGRASEEGT